MSELEHLAEELRKQLRASVDDLMPSAELTARVEAIPSSGAAGVRRRLGVRGRRIAFAVPVSIIAIVAAAVTLFGGSNVTPSYAGAILVLPER